MSWKKVTLGDPKNVIFLLVSITHLFLYIEMDALKDTCLWLQPRSQTQ